jgi:hypothetical protein
VSGLIESDWDLFLEGLTLIIRNNQFLIMDFDTVDETLWSLLNRENPSAREIQDPRLQKIKSGVEAENNHLFCICVREMGVCVWIMYGKENGVTSVKINDKYIDMKGFCV